MIPAKTDMAVSKDIRGMRDMPQDESLHRQQWPTEQGTVRAVGVPALPATTELNPPPPFPAQDPQHPAAQARCLALDRP